MKTLIELSDKSLIQIFRLSKQRQNEIKPTEFEKSNWELEKLKSKWNQKNGDNQQQENSQQKFWLN